MTEYNSCRAASPYQHNDRCSFGRIQSPNPSFTRMCEVCDGTGMSRADAVKDAYERGINEAAMAIRAAMKNTACRAGFKNVHLESLRREVLELIDRNRIIAEQLNEALSAIASMNADPECTSNKLNLEKLWEVALTGTMKPLEDIHAIKVLAHAAWYHRSQTLASAKRIEALTAMIRMYDHQNRKHENKPQI